MSGFSADWLALREPLDAQARALELVWAFGAALPPDCRLADLGAGTGSNMRFLAPRLGRIAQDWTLLEHDPLLIDRAPVEIARWAKGRGARVATEGPALRLLGDAVTLAVRIRELDLVGHLDRLDLGSLDAVTASALFDLVSQTWLEDFATVLAAARLPPLLAALTVDGRVDFTPEDPADAAVLDRFHRHMRRDKGFGPALGPEAPAALHRTLAAAGYRVWSARSDWQVGPDRAAAQAHLIEGYAGAAAIADPAFAGEAEAWKARRLALARERMLSLRVGHADVVALR